MSVPITNPHYTNSNTTNADMMMMLMQQQQQQQKVRVVSGYALQQRLGSGSFATVYKGIKIAAGAAGGATSTSTSTLNADADAGDNGNGNGNASTTQEHPAEEVPSTGTSTSNGSSSTNGDEEDEQPDIVAIKAIARTSEKLTKKVLQNLEIEISILRTYRHPNIVCMHNVQKTERHFYLILEYCGGGDVQRLIRTRKAGRLSERLTRRLMRDLSAGLKFLWGQELIHRDIKPQNLLLTGALPLDEMYDPDHTPEEEASRRQINFPSEQFALKIADFGFARHLQTASLAETLCGSPLYMAPEILQHHRYDAKADLWSVGTVLFEMIAGRPPFNGENHIDLLRNIKTKAVRLPPGMRVSKACVNLLRLLLNRDPLSRAGFKEFFEACDVFVALGCEGEGTNDSAGSCNRIAANISDLGTIRENDAGSASGGSDSLMTVATASHPQQQQQQQQQQTTQSKSSSARIVSPALAPTPAPPTALISQTSIGAQQQHHHHHQALLARQYPNRLAPLTQSPPTSAQTFLPSGVAAATMPSVPHLGLQAMQPWQQQANYNTAADWVPASSSSNRSTTRPELTQSQASADGGDSEFVMVEHGANSRNDFYDQTGVPNWMVQPTNTGGGGGGPPTNNGGTPYYVNNPLVSNNNSNMGGGFRRSGSKGMLSTSPGTGGLLMGLVMGGRARLGQQQPQNPNPSFGEEFAAANKLLATAEDVGRRAVSVAHLGDTRAYIGMRLVHANNNESSSLLSSTPMEDVEEEPNEEMNNKSKNNNNNNNDNESDDSSSTEIMAPARRRSSVSSDKIMSEAKQEVDNDDQTEEMPFAISPPTPAVALPSRGNSTVSAYHKSSSMSSMKRPVQKVEPTTIRAHFGEALSCYLKALKMLKSAVGAAQRVSKDLETLMSQMGRSPTDYDIPKMQRRCEVTANWLSEQFHGVLERADAANVEMNKLPSSPPADQQEIPPITSVEELIYNHSLASGRDGAVKQLLGQYEAARSCYRSAGLLAETLLMEANISTEDRQVLEGYVDGFAARITELDQLMLQQSSRMIVSSNASSTNRGSGVIGLIGPPPAAPTGFMVGPTRYGS